LGLVEATAGDVQAYLSAEEEEQCYGEEEQCYGEEEEEPEYEE